LHALFGIALLTRFHGKASALRALHFASHGSNLDFPMEVLGAWRRDPP
jgi:hypothetical protein